MEFKNVGVSDWIKKLNRQDLAIFLMPAIIFSIYLFIFNPGIATYDSFNQIHQIASGHFTNWHPFFHTLIELLCLKVYPNTMSICVFQILVFSTMWMIICKYHRDDGSFKWQAIFTLIICLIPINSLYSITLWKDVLFSYFLMFLCFLAKVLIDRKGNVDYRFVILLSLIMAFVAEMRGNGIYVILLCIVIYSAYLIYKKNMKTAALLAILTVTFILLIASLNIVYDVEDNEKDAMMTKVTHMLADYDMNLEMEDSDRAKIHDLIDKDRINEFYMPTDSDPILSITNFKEFRNNQSTYIDLAIKYSLKNPIYCLQYLFKSPPIVWDITRNVDWVGHAFYMNKNQDRLQSDFKHYYGNKNYTPTEPYENISYVNWGTPAFKFLNSLSIDTENNVIADTLFDSPALYMYLSIILLIVMQIILKTKEIYLMYVPNLLNIMTIFLSTPIQDNRYLYANLLVCYLLIIIFIGLRKKVKKKDNLVVC